MVNLATQTLLVSVAFARLLLFPAIGFDWHAELIAHAIGLVSPIPTGYWAYKRYSFAGAHAAVNQRGAVKRLFRWEPSAVRQLRRGVEVGAVDGLALASAMIGTILLIVPFMPAMPSSGLDASWVSALNEALFKGLLFGRDLVFSFGPLASVYTGQYHPDTDAAMLVGNLVIAIGFFSGFAVLCSPDRLLLTLLLPFVVGLGVHPDGLFITLPLIVLLIAVRLSRPANDPMHLGATPWVAFGMVAAIAATAISPLIKASFAGPAFAGLGLAFLVLLKSNQRIAFGLILATLAPLYSAWVLVGQPVGELVNFFVSQAPVVAGYTTGMSVRSKVSGPTVYMLAGLGMAALFFRDFCHRNGFGGVAAITGLSFILFVLLKAGFVRHDGHQLIPAHALLLSGLVLATVVRRPTAYALGTIAFLGWGFIERIEFRKWPIDAPHRIVSRAGNAVSGIVTRSTNYSSLSRRFESANRAIRESNPLPPVQGSVDLYPYNLAPIFAGGFQWSGRPALQSYAAYSPPLNLMNAAHLTSSRAPDSIFFSINPIDERLPSLEDSTSLPEILARYEVSGYVSPYLQMERRSTPAPAPLGAPWSSDATKHSLNADIPVSLQDNVWAAVEVRPTIVGRVLMTAFKLPQLQIALSLDNGRVVRYRFIPGMAQPGFILSPLLTSTDDFLGLAAGLEDLPKVTSFRIETPHSSGWDTEIKVQFKPLYLQPQPKARELLLQRRTASPSKPG